jgi:DNA mismatch repair protein MutS2
MHAKSLQTLEYPKILERLADETAFSASRELALALQPADDLSEVRRRQQYTTEARRLLDMRPDAGVQAAHDVRPLVALAERGGMLNVSELLDILDTLRSAAHVSRLLGRLDESFPRLRALVAGLPVRPALERRISESISEEGEVLDSASSTLRRLRLEIRQAQQRLHERLQALLNELRPALQEAIITIRADRYVLPVKAEAQSQVKGIVHDRSASGATVFIEPLVVVELNNHLRQLQVAERQEIERILLALSGEVGREAAAIKNMVEVLAEVDLHLAKARYSARISGNEPQLNDIGRVNLIQARHPLLTGKVVPINFRLGTANRAHRSLLPGGEEADTSPGYLAQTHDGRNAQNESFSMVVITGPNTGGKTVALKTVGLLTLMAAAGLHIPADAQSEVAVFSNVFADIGDEQSIEQSLSTFSSHMSRIVDILTHLDDRSLVLLDELGAGTDPSEGSALARAILMYLLERGVLTIATTHYTELKAFAHEQPGVVNASVEFDVETLSPTYHLSIGLPGRSNALAIASRLGLPEAIINRARELLGSSGLAMETLLEDLQANQRAVADERFHLSIERAAATELRRQLEIERARLEEERVRILNEARVQAQRELADVRATLAQVRSEIARIQHAWQRVQRAHNRAGGVPDQQTLDMLRTIIDQTAERTAPLPQPSRSSAEGDEEVLPGPIQVGDLVRVRRYNQSGEVLALLDGGSEVEVQLGIFKTRLPVTEVERISRRKAARRAAPATATTTPYEPSISLPDISTRTAPAMELDLRGWRVEDMLPELDRYLNDAFMAGLPSVRIIHGKGTGALRQAVREQLAHHPLVKSHTAGSRLEGGEGVTIAILNH